MPRSEPVLVDTHALLWWQAQSKRVSPRARRRLDAAAPVLVSPISCWEVAMLVAKGRVGLDRPVSRWVDDLLADPGVEAAALTADVAVLAGELDDFHGDPADRLIYATAVTLAVPLLTKDARMRRFAAAQGGVDIVW